MVNRKGQIRIIEAAIAVMLVLGFVIFAQQAPRADISNSVYRIQHQILVEISWNESLRESVVNKDVSGSAGWAESRLKPYGLNFEMSICHVQESCICKTCPSGKSVYGDSIIISGSLPEYNPSKLAMFVWG